VALVSDSKLRTERYLADCRALTLAEIKRFLPSDVRNTAGLYDLMLDYPMRPAKALRPALCIGTCMALGGHLDAALPSAAALELFHNAFLVHDDVEDGSELRRHAATLPLLYGVPIAVNVGDGMLALSLEPLLDNVRALGLGRALHVLRTFARMARESVEGQMLELDWTRNHRWDITDREYLRMVHKKTGWYSFVAPVLVGAMVAGAEPETSATLGRFALLLGIAFQIQDDLLSLEGAESEVGKEALGDLWEGKYTLPLLHALRSLAPAERDEALAILGRSRPPAGSSRAERESREAIWDKLVANGDLTSTEQALLKRALLGDAAGHKSEQDVTRLSQLVMGRDRASIAHARRIARRHATRAARTLERDLRELPASVHRDFLQSLVSFVVDRAR
jgi:geranylgeranyl diphosphate synthase type II